MDGRIPEAMPPSSGRHTADRQAAGKQVPRSCATLVPGERTLATGATRSGVLASADPA